MALIFLQEYFALPYYEQVKWQEQYSHELGWFKFVLTITVNIIVTLDQISIHFNGVPSFIGESVY